MPAAVIRERPILFKAEMVRAILEGRKKQTRRVIALPRWTVADDVLYMEEEDPPWPHAISAYSGCMARVECPYGVPGDRLWVRESWGLADYGGRLIDPCLNYKADGGQLPLIGHASPDTWSHAYSAHEVNDADLLKVEDGWRNAMFMPRWVSRITLDLAQVRVQRVQEISNEDAFAEGCDFRSCGAPNHVMAFASLWDSINLKRGFGWASNPWVWALTFKRLEGAR